MNMNGGIIMLNQLNWEFEVFRPRLQVFQDNGDSVNLDPLLDSLLFMLGYLHADQEMGCGDGPRQRPLHTAAPPSPSLSLSPALSYDSHLEEEHRAGAEHEEQAWVEPEVEEASDGSERSEGSLEVHHEPLDQSSQNGPCAAGRGSMGEFSQSLYDRTPVHSFYMVLGRSGVTMINTTANVTQATSTTAAPAREEKRQRRFCQFFSSIFSKKSKSKPSPAQGSSRSGPWWRRIFSRICQKNSYYANN